MSFVLLKAIGLVIPLRADANDESVGLDVSQHGEEAYIHAQGPSVIEPVEKPRGNAAVPAIEIA